MCAYPCPIIGAHVDGPECRYDVGGEINESFVLATAVALTEKGLLAAGYVHLNLDDGFIATANRSAHFAPPRQDLSELPDPGGRLANGSLYADKERFPHGMAALSAAVMALGVRLGAYTARGRLTCMGRAGSLGHEKEDMRRFAIDWNLSYIKIDSCHGVPADPPGTLPGTVAIEQYRNFSRVSGPRPLRGVLHSSNPSPPHLHLVSCCARGPRVSSNVAESFRRRELEPRTRSPQ